MKLISAILLLFPTLVFAAESSETIQITDNISTQRLRCEIHAYGADFPVEEKTFTVLGTPNYPIFSPREGAMELTHKYASAKGCDIAPLDKIADNARMRFGFVLGAPVTILKETSASRRVRSNRCIANYKETVTFDMGEGVILKSIASEVRDMNDCQ